MKYEFVRRRLQDPILTLGGNCILYTGPILFGFDTYYPVSLHQRILHRVPCPPTTISGRAITIAD